MNILAMLLIVLTSLSGSPDLEVDGHVYDESGNPLPGVNVIVKGTTRGTVTDLNGYFSLKVPDEKAKLVFAYVGYVSAERSIELTEPMYIILKEDLQQLSEVVVSGLAVKGRSRKIRVRGMSSIRGAGKQMFHSQPAGNSEEYLPISEEGFLAPGKHPLSTFSIDVDGASYANVRRFLSQGNRPPADAVRIEEMVNYFDYNYDAPSGDDPFSVVTEVSESPWNKHHKLVHIGLQGVKVETGDLPAGNLVFLLDVSGSMNSPDKLPLLKSSLKMLVGQLRPQDHVSIVVYAGAAGVVLEPTSGDNKAAILSALERLNAGGSTAGGAGIELAYALAGQEFDPEKNNRVILATDGDFNVGISDVRSLERLIEQKRESGISLTVLGFGTGNLKDNRMETLANKGNGNYAYIDSILEARKVLIEEMGGTLLTIARDVKVQVEFNPANVQAYRLIGYENRRLNDEDFNDDRKDAGELGAGHSVTALYEVIPAGIRSDTYSVDPLRYQVPETSESRHGGELLTVKLRYKKPTGGKSILLSQVVKNNSVILAEASENFRWSAAVAAFAMQLRQSPYLGSEFTLRENISLAEGARGTDRNGYRSEFIRLMEVQESF